MTAIVQVEIPRGLSALASAPRVIALPVEGPVTQRSVLDALEAAYPALKGTVRDQASQRRRRFVRFLACQQDLSHAAPDDALPPQVAAGTEVFMIVGAIAGG